MSVNIQQNLDDIFKKLNESLNNFNTDSHNFVNDITALLEKSSISSTPSTLNRYYIKLIPPKEIRININNFTRKTLIEQGFGQKSNNSEIIAKNSKYIHITLFTINTTDKLKKEIQETIQETLKSIEDIPVIIDLYYNNLDLYPKYDEDKKFLVIEYTTILSQLNLSIWHLNFLKCRIYENIYDKYLKNYKNLISEPNKIQNPTDMILNYKASRFYDNNDNEFFNIRYDEINTDLFHITIDNQLKDNTQNIDIHKKYKTQIENVNKIIKFFININEKLPDARDEFLKNNLHLFNNDQEKYKNFNTNINKKNISNIYHLKWDFNKDQIIFEQ